MSISFKDKLIDATKLIGVCVGIPTAIIATGMLTIGLIELGILEEAYEQDMDMYETEIAFEKKLAKLAQEQANINFKTLNISEVEVVEVEGKNYLSLKCKALIEEEKGIQAFRLILDCDDYYWPIIQKDLKNMKLLEQVEYYEEHLQKTLPEDSMLLTYQRDLIATLFDLTKSSETNLISIVSTNEDILFDGDSPDSADNSVL